MKKLLFILLLTVSCVYDPGKKISKIKVINNTDESFYVYTSCFDNLQKKPSLKYYKNEKDSSIQIEEIIPGFKVTANSNDEFIYLYDYDVKSFFKNCKKGKLNIFLIKENILINHSWEDIYNKQLYYRKLSLNEEYFNTKDYILIN